MTNVNEKMVTKDNGSVEFVYWDGDSRNGENVPTIKIHNHNLDYYLQPFRYYRMQVSGTIDQHTCYGCSEVVGLINIVEFYKYSNTENYMKKRNFHSNTDGYQMNYPFLDVMIDQLSIVALRNARFDQNIIDKVLRSDEYDKFIIETKEYLIKRYDDLNSIFEK